MGTKTIWDGEQLPPVGCEVLIHLASVDKWVPYTVEGFTIKKQPEGYDQYTIHVTVYRTDGGKKITNCRLLGDIRPVDWREGEQEQAG